MNAPLADDEEALMRTTTRHRPACGPGLHIVATSNGAEAWDDCLQHEPQIAFPRHPHARRTGLSHRLRAAHSHR